MAHLAVIWLSIEAGHDWLLGVAPRLHLHGEANIPAFLSALGLAAAALITAKLARLDGAARPGDRWCWAFICGLLLFMAFDEAAKIHELLNPLGGDGAGAGIFFYVWVLPYAVLVLLCVAILLPFWWRLPAATRFGLAAAAAGFCASAIGMELVESALLADAPDRLAAYRTWSVIAAVTVEETGEMLAVAYAIRTLLRPMGQGRPGRVVALDIK